MVRTYKHSLVNSTYVLTLGKTPHYARSSQPSEPQARKLLNTATLSHDIPFAPSMLTQPTAAASHKKILGWYIPVTSSVNQELWIHPQRDSYKMKIPRSLQLMEAEN